MFTQGLVIMLRGLATKFYLSFANKFSYYVNQGLIIMFSH
jgi:hypothetical protein